MKKAFIFPGQGAQYVGMGKDFFDTFTIARETFQEADDILKENLSKIIFEGPEEQLTQTRNAQIAIFVASLAILRTLQQQLPDLRPDVCAGLSLGEYTALCASGRLGFAQTLLLVRERARLMQEACEKTTGTMAAVLGLDALSIEAAMKGLKNVWVANYNAPGQTVISGTKEGIDLAALILKGKGAKRIIPLAVSGAFHSGLMQSAQDGLAPFVQAAKIQDSPIPFVMNVPGRFVQILPEIQQNLIHQVTHSVRWEQSIEAMKGAGVEQFFEIGCGKTLSGLNKKMEISFTMAMDKVADLDGVNHAIA